MKSFKHIVLLDPSLGNNNGAISNNLGDLIIYESIKEVLKEIFPEATIVRVSTHVEIGSTEKKILKSADITFVGGSNLLCSNIRHFNRFTPKKNKGFYLFPGFKNTVLIGAGWNNYDQPPDWATKIYYRKILNKEYYQSLRDNYSVNQLNHIGLNKNLNTCCPTAWNLNTDFVNKFNPKLNTILYTVNGFHNIRKIDENIIEIIFRSEPKDIFFFPQTTLDIEYFSTLEIYKKNKKRFKIMGLRIEELLHLLKSIKLNYIGARLHSGIRCLKENNPTLILGFDNRAFEINKDTKLNVVDFTDLNTINNWVMGKYIPPLIELPKANILLWKNQFK